MFAFRSAVLTAALLARTAGVASAAGCYPAYSTSALDTYKAGSKVSATKTVTTTVNGTESSTTETRNYECVGNANSAYCKQSAFAPGGQYSDTAWIEEPTACTGTATPPPATAPTPAAWSGGGCPKAFAAGTAYSAEAEVSVVGPSHTMVYQCKASPLNQFCGQAGYEPGDSLYWEQAWDSLGSCNGTIAPTGSPNYVSLTDMGGCPDEWASQTYEEGDKVSKDGLVYKCKAWPYSGHCGQAGYEPNIDPATPGAWKDAWTVVGYCEGSTGPTASPSFDPLDNVGACPDEWVAGSNVKYEGGDSVSVTVSETPLRKVVYTCKDWPYSGFCGQFSPTQNGGDQGWTLAGSCDGSIGPTASPSFDDLALTGDGCPREWSATDYAAGDTVSITVSSSPERKIVYKCKDWPASGYCSQGEGFKPTAQYGDMAWKEEGYCNGTIAPTASPTSYAGNCTFAKKVETTVTNCTPGSAGCSCNAGQPASTSCTRVDVTYPDAEVAVWSAAGVPGYPGGYVQDDQVRLGATKFKCKQWPYYLWCANEAYKPSLAENDVIWKNAWIKLTDPCQ